MRGKLAAAALVFTLLVAASTSLAFASPPFPGKVTVAQPSGETLEVTLHGDEWFHWTADADGAVIVQAEDGYWYYASWDGESLTPLKERAGIDARPEGALGRETLAEAAKAGKAKAEASLQKSASVRRAGGAESPDGPENLLVLLISFTDISIANSPAYWSGKMFADHSAYATKTDTHSSVNDYYREVSGNTFWFEPAGETGGTAGDGVIQVSLPYLHPAYPSDDATFVSHSRQVASDALAAADGAINFSAYDADGNGTVSANELHIVMILAGYEQATGYGSPAVWAHSTGLPSPVWLDGVRVGGDYTQQGEIQAYTGTLMCPATIGVLAHELGHSLGLPDLYDYGYDSLGAGPYSLMAGGSWECNSGSYPGSSPAHLDAWSKVVLGFVTPVTATAGEHTLRSVATGAYNALLVPTNDPKQYFLLENRQCSYGYDKALDYYFVSGGIAVWHIDNNVLDASPYWMYINDDETHKAVDLEEANEGILGYSQLDSEVSNYHIYNHLYCTGNANAASVFNGSTTPSSRLYGGGDSTVAVNVLSSSGNTMQVAVQAGLAITALTADKPSPQFLPHTIRWTCAASGGTNITYRFDVTRDGAPAGGTGGYSASNVFDWTPDAPGSYTVTASALADGVSVPQTRSATFVITQSDVSPPAISAQAGGAQIADGAVAQSPVTVSVTDDSGSLALLTYSVDGGAAVAQWPSGGLFTAQGDYTVTAADAAGNTSTFRFGLRPYAGVLTVRKTSGAEVPDGGATAKSVKVTLNNQAWKAVSYLNGKKTAWKTRTKTFTAEGAYTVKATGPSGETVTRSFFIDKASPAITAKNARRGTVRSGSAQKYAVTVSIKDTTLASKAATLNGGAVDWPADNRFTAEGRYVVTAADALGRSKSFSFTVDLASPVVAAVDEAGQPVANKAYGTSNVTVSVSDTALARTAVKKNGRTAKWPSGGVFSSDGTYVITATDKLNRRATLTFTIDRTAPVAKGRQANGRAAVNGGVYNKPVTITNSDRNPAANTAFRDGAAIAWPSRGRFAASGTYSVVVYDRAGNRSEAFTFTIDTAKPVIAVQALDGGAVARSRSAAGGAVVTVSDGNLASKSAKLGKKTVAWPDNDTFTTPGAYTVTARDRAGNVSTFVFSIK